MERSFALTLVHAVFGAAGGLLLLLNGVAPYLGLKFEYSMAMYSNLTTAADNHLFLPGAATGPAHDYHVVAALDLPDGDPTESGRLFRELLRRAGHPAAGSHDESPRPVHGDVIRHHLALYREAGVPATVTLRHADTGAEQTLSAADARPEWQTGGVFMGYPPVRHGYEEAHAVLADHFDR